MDLREVIQRIARGGAEMYCKICTVDDVDEKARTVDCTPLDESAPLVGVNLQANQSGVVGAVLLPAKGSYVVLGFLSENVAVVLLSLEVTKAVLTVGKAEVVMEDNNATLTTEKVSVHVTGDTAKIDVDGTTLEFDGSETIFNGGAETTANATELQKQLTTMSGRIDAIINALGSAAVAAMDGGKTYQTNLTAALSPHLANKEDFSQIIDDKIKH